MLDRIAGSDRRSTLTALAVAVAAGLMWPLATPPLGLWPLAWLAPVPLLWLVDRAPTSKRARRYAWLVGIVTSAVGFYWVIGLLTRYSSFAAPLALLALLLLAAYQGLIFWLLAVAVRAIRTTSAERMGRPLPMALVAPVVIVAVETAFPLIFPYNLAITQAFQPLVIQLAELTGPVGVTGLLFAVGGGIYDLASARRWRPAAGAAAVVAAALVFGAVRMGQIDDRRADAPELTVGLVQANIPYDGPEASELGALDRLAAIQRLTARLEADGAELVVWPEASMPFAFPRRAVPGPLELPVRHQLTSPERAAPTPTFDGPLVFGALTVGDPAKPPYNSVFLGIGDQAVARYDKKHLVMFSEHIPGSDTFPWLADVLPRGTANFTAGDELTTFELPVGDARYRLAPMICFEDTLPGFSREVAEHRPHLLVNLTNDTWFGDTAEPWQHLALSVFRAVELRSDLVRAVNSGVTSYIDASGRVRLETEVIDPGGNPQPPAGHLVRVRLLEGGSGLFVRAGNLLGFLCLLATLAGWLGWPRIRTKKRPVE